MKSEEKRGGVMCAEGARFLYLLHRLGDVCKFVAFVGVTFDALGNELASRDISMPKFVKKVFEPLFFLRRFKADFFVSRV